MDKTYYYEKRFFNFRITFIGILSTIIMLYAAVRLITDKNAWSMLAPFTIGLYAFWESFVSLANPSAVRITDESVTFMAYGRQHTYLWKDITKLQIKELPTAKKLFMRINDPGFLKGRYWLACMEFSDGDELYHFFLDKEYEMHPDTLKARSRRSAEDSKAARQKELADKAAHRQRKLEQRAREAALEEQNNKKA